MASPRPWSGIGITAIADAPASSSVRSEAKRFVAASARSPEALRLMVVDAPAGASTTINLSTSSDLAEAATNLFASLRALDEAGASAIAVMPIPDQGLGEAINDRLRRAAKAR